MIKKFFLKIRHLKNKKKLPLPLPPPAGVTGVYLHSRTSGVLGMSVKA